MLLISISNIVSSLVEITWLNSESIIDLSNEQNKYYLYLGNAFWFFLG